MNERDELNSIKWNQFLDNPETSSDLKDLIIHFLDPYKISPMKFIMHLEASSSGNYYGYGDYLSPNTVGFLTGSLNKAMGYPDWFYLAFPDVAKWAIDGSGMEIIEKQFAHLPEDECIDSSTGTLKESLLKKIIEAYLNCGHELECQNL